MPIPEYVKARIEKKDPTYKRLNLRRCAISDDEVVEVIKLIQENPFIEALDLSDNSINKGAVLLKNLPSHIINLDISSNNIDDNTLKQFYPFISSVTLLNIGWNNLTKDSYNLFTEDKIRIYLNIRGNDFDSSSIALIEKHIEQNKVKSSNVQTNGYHQQQTDEIQSLSMVN